MSSATIRKIGSEPSGGSGGAGGADLVSAITSALPALVGLFTAIFGDKWAYSTGVRWLTAYYQYYVLGDGAVTSSNKVNEKYTGEAQGWFSVVLGVPIYDRYRLHALMGTEPGQGAPLNNSDQQRAENYLNPAWTDTQGQPLDKVMRAVQIAKQFKWGVMPGTWAKYGIPADPPEVVSEQPGGGSVFTDASGKPNYLLWGGIAAAVIGLYVWYDSDS